MNPGAAGSHAVVMAALEAARGGLGDEFVRCFSEDLDFWFPGTTPISGRRRGLGEFREYLAQVASYLSEMIELELTNVITTGEWVITEALGHGVTRKGTWGPPRIPAPSKPPTSWSWMSTSTFTRSSRA